MFEYCEDENDDENDVVGHGLSLQSVGSLRSMQGREAAQDLHVLAHFHSHSEIQLGSFTFRNLTKYFKPSFSLDIFHNM